MRSISLDFDRNAGAAGCASIKRAFLSKSMAGKKKDMKPALHKEKMEFELMASMMCADYGNLEREVQNLDEGGIPQSCR